MVNNQEYYQYGSEQIALTSKRDVYEKIYLRAIIETYLAIKKSKATENKIRDRILIHLQQKHAVTASLFQNEILDIFPERHELISETEQRRSDICFHWSSSGRFIIECKRLFQQPSKNEAYLNDGLIRFIELKYASTNEFAGMIGFIVSGDIDTIFKEIMKAVVKFHPTTPPKSILTPIDKRWKHGFISFHTRIDSRDIHIYHLFFNFK